MKTIFEALLTLHIALPEVIMPASHNVMECKKRTYVPITVQSQCIVTAKQDMTLCLTALEEEFIKQR